MNEEKEHKVLELIKEESYRNYFFRKAKDIKWFYPLKSAGYFNATNVPDPVQVKEGFQIPLWIPLLYLEQVSLQIAEGKHHEYIDEIINIIKTVSEAKKDNYRVWYHIIKILVNIPNERIPIEVLDYIHVWLESRSDPMLQSSELCGKLLPKFLIENPTREDTEKAERVLLHALSLKRVESKKEAKVWGGEGFSYVPLIYLHCLKDSIIDKGLVERIAKHCSNAVVFDLADKLKMIFRVYQTGLHTQFSVNEKKYIVRAFIEEMDLLITAYPENAEVNEKELQKELIKNYESYEIPELLKKVKEKIEDLGISLTESENADEKLRSIAFTLNNDASTIWCSSIHKLGEKYHHRDNLKNTFALILRDLLNEKAKHQKKETKGIIKVFLSKQYKLPFFTRLVLYVISESWSEYKTFFWGMVKNEDEAHCFSSYQYDKELYFLLRNNIQHFDQQERMLLNTIIDKGPQDEREGRNDDYNEYWQLKWYAALKNDEEYRSKYQELSKKLDITNEHYENLGEVRISSGSVSPHTLEDILQKDNSEIVKEIFEFRPKDRWKDPSIDGFSSMLGKAVQKKPDKFANEIEQYEGIYYIYAYHLLQGFQSAWKDKKPFDWEKVLTFCLNYITSEGFIQDKLLLENDGWGVTKSWVTGVIGNLITEGTQSDDNAFNKELLPIAEKILSALIPTLEAVYDVEETKMDYPTYSLNSTAGKLLRALLDCSLRSARLEHEGDKSEGKKWEDKAKGLFESTIKKGIIDGYILQGMYFRQFNYLDKDWIVEKVKEYYELPERYWLAFMGGYVFNNAIKDKEVYELMIPHFKRVIEKKIEFKGFNDSGIIIHLAAYYFWQYESVTKGTLIPKFLNEAEPKQIDSLVHFFWTQKEYMLTLNKDEKEQFVERVIELWNHILERFKNDKGEEVLKLLSGLSKLAMFLERIDQNNIDLLKTSAQVINYDFNSPFFIEELESMKEKGEPRQTAKYLGEILQIMLANFTPDYDQKHIVSLVSFLYQNKADIEVKQMADDICNEYGKRGYEFLRELYKQNNQ